MAVPRRIFLKSGAVALIGVGAGLDVLPSFLVRAATVARGRGKTLVVVFQRGAADGLNMVVPHAERAYYELRPTIAIARPKKGSAQSALDLDGFFGLHPALAPFKGLYAAKQLAVVHAAGSPDASRSHFDAQDFMESGTPGVRSTSDGWLNRYLASHRVEGPTSFRAVAATARLPRILAGPAPALAIPRLREFGLGQGRAGGLARHGLERLYAEAQDPLLQPAGREALEAVKVLERVEASSYAPADGAEYPQGAFGQSMLQIAQLINAGVGLEIAFAEIGGWDHHVNEGGSTGPLARQLRQFAAGLDAFVRDLGERMEDVVVVSLSEFGRTAGENGNRGTDHGHANAMFVIGGPVKGGKVYGRWPGLEREQLHEGRDLALTTDYRDILATVLARHLGANDLSTVFPGHAIQRDAPRVV